MALSAATSLLRSTFDYLKDIPRRDALILTSFATSLGSALYGNNIFHVAMPIFLYLANSSKDPSDRPMQSRIAKINLVFSGVLLGKLLLGGSNALEATFALINTAAATDLYASKHFKAQLDLSSLRRLGPTPWVDLNFPPT